MNASQYPEGDFRAPVPVIARVNGAAAGIGDGLIRVAVGLDDVEDIRRDLQRGFDAIA